MPEIQIRPVVATDIPYLKAIDHGYYSDYVWQMDLANEERSIGVSFRETRLPRSVRVEYPRKPELLEKDWKKRPAMLVSVLGGEPVGYISLDDHFSQQTAWVTDIAIKSNFRRKGIASALLVAGQEWAVLHDKWRMVVEMQSKNHPAIRMVTKLGFDFCGYNDHFYSNQDIAIFFAQELR
jgi:ribosomal protein S18 acetylase RimI-like enzyme